MIFMSLIFPHIDKLNETDITDVLEIVNSVFPYVTFSEDLIKEKLKSNNFFLIKYHQKNVLIGFLELEFIDNKLARLNAVFVSDAFRCRGIATKLINKAVHECRRKRIKKIFLLVKEDNLVAKNLYKKQKFVFVKLHDKELDGSIIEVWEKEI